MSPFLLNAQKARQDMFECLFDSPAPVMGGSNAWNKAPQRLESKPFAPLANLKVLEMMGVSAQRNIWQVAGDAPFQCWFRKLDRFVTKGPSVRSCGCIER